MRAQHHQIAPGLSSNPAECRQRSIARGGAAAFITRVHDKRRPRMQFA